MTQYDQRMTQKYPRMIQNDTIRRTQVELRMAQYELSTTQYTHRITQYNYRMTQNDICRPIRLLILLQNVMKWSQLLDCLQSRTLTYKQNVTQCDPTPDPAQPAWALLIKIPSCQNVLLPDFYLGVLVQPLMFIIGHMSPKCLLTPDILDMRDLAGFCMGLVTPCYRGSRNTLFKSIWAIWPQNGHFWCSDSTYIWWMQY